MVVDPLEVIAATGAFITETVIVATSLPQLFDAVNVYVPAVVAEIELAVLPEGCHT